MIDYLCCCCCCCYLRACTVSQICMFIFIVRLVWFRSASIVGPLKNYYPHRVGVGSFSTVPVLTTSYGENN